MIEKSQRIYRLHSLVGETISFIREQGCILFKVLVVKSYLTLCNPTHCSPPGPFVHGIPKARILEWVTIPFSRGSSWLRDHPTPFSGLPCFPAVTDVNWVKRAIWCPGGKRGWPVGLFCIRPVLFILHGVPGLRQTVQLGTCPAFLRNCHLHLPRWVLWIWGTLFTQDLLLLLMLHT